MRLYCKTFLQHAWLYDDCIACSINIKSTRFPWMFFAPLYRYCFSFYSFFSFRLSAFLWLFLSFFIILCLIYVIKKCFIDSLGKWLEEHSNIYKKFAQFERMLPLLSTFKLVLLHEGHATCRKNRGRKWLYHNQN